MIGFLCYLSDGQIVTMHTTSLKEAHLLLKAILPVFVRIQVWTAGNTENLLWNSTRLLGDTEHTIYVDNLGYSQSMTNSQK